jgi:hypothetical protein
MAESVSTSLRWRAGADDCEHVGKEREQSRDSIVGNSEQKAALIASAKGMAVSRRIAFRHACCEPSWISDSITLKQSKQEVAIGLARQWL